MTLTSATGNKSLKGQAGFTITEILIVMALIGLAARAVVLVLPNDDRALRQEVETFAARLKAAQDVAVFSNRSIFGIVTGFGYRFEERRGDAWQVTATNTLKATDWSDDTQVLLASGGRARIELGNLGAVSPTRIAFSRGDARLALDLNYDGTIEIHRDE
ncbi:MAG: GspH/FimT family pseudopilin [Pseudomonadota bacterium]